MLRSQFSFPPNSGFKCSLYWNWMNEWMNIKQSYLAWLDSHSLIFSIFLLPILNAIYLFLYQQNCTADISYAHALYFLVYGINLVFDAFFHYCLICIDCCLHIFFSSTRIWYLDQWVQILRCFHAESNLLSSSTYSSTRRPYS